MVPEWRVCQPAPDSSAQKSSRRDQPARAVAGDDLQRDQPAPAASRWLGVEHLCAGWVARHRKWAQTPQPRPEGQAGGPDQDSADPKGCQSGPGDRDPFDEDRLTNISTKITRKGDPPVLSADVGDPGYAKGWGDRGYAANKNGRELNRREARWYQSVPCGGRCR